VLFARLSATNSRRVSVAVKIIGKKAGISWLHHDYFRMEAFYLQQFDLSRVKVLKSQGQTKVRLL
jgi:hypothetical protein